MRPAIALLAALSVAAPAQAATKLLPFPSNAYTKKDKRTATGIRLNLKLSQMPKNADGTPVAPTDINRFDGFSPGSVILVKLTKLDTPAELAKLKPVGLADLSRYKAKKAPIFVTDAKSRKRWPIWVELDSNTTSAANTLVEIHPAKNFLEGHTYVVNMRKLHKPWRFTVASRRSLTERMLHIRNDAFKQLGDTNLADLKVQGSAPKFTVTQVTHPTVEEDPDIAADVSGTFQVPCYLDQPGCPAGSKFNLDPKTGLPAQMPGNELTASFRCMVPRSAGVATPARPALYGHGLLGSNSEVHQQANRDMSNEHNILSCATNWYGMSSEDVVNAISVLRDGSKMPSIADRLQQGMLAQLYLGRLMISPTGLSSDPNFAGLIDTSRLYYDGNSQGGIMGGALTPYAPDYQRAALGVTGMNYSVLLLRSKDWDTYAAIFNPSYPNELERPLVIDLLQLMWDRGEADGPAQHMTTSPLPNTPKHTVLLHSAIGDQQVTTFQAEVEARTIGASARRPAADLGRLPETKQLWGLPTIKKFPFAGSAIVIWDSGPGHNGPSPLTNTPPRDGTDPHEDIRRTVAARQQKSDFFGGAMTDPCDPATACRTDFYMP